MSETNRNLIGLGLTSLTAVVVTVSVWTATKKRVILSNVSPVCKRSIVPPTEWIDQGAFEVLTAICDALMPSVNTKELTIDRLRESVEALHLNLTKATSPLSDEFIQKNEGYLCRGAIDMNLHMIAAQALGTVITEAEQSQLWLMLKLLSYQFGCHAITGYPVAFQNLPLHYRVKVLQSWRDGFIPPLRVFYQTVKRLIGNLFYSYVDHGVENPNWASIGYRPAETVGKQQRAVEAVQTEHEAAVDRYLRRKVSYQSAHAALHTPTAQSPSQQSSDDVLEVDVVIVGSGSGGGMMASQLAKAGLSVLVLEKGGYYRPAEFKAWRESEAFLHTFEKGGLCSTVDGNVLVLAGSCVGGGSTVNWSASFRTPDYVCEDWVKLGLSQFSKDGEIHRSLDTVHGLLSVNSDHSHRDCVEEEQARIAAVQTGTKPFVVNGNNTLLWEGSKKLGFTPEKIPRNVKNCVDCGHCCHGCPYKSKQSTQTALMEPLLLAGSGLEHASCQGSCASATSATTIAAGYKLHVIPHCHVTKILYETTGAGSVKGGDGSVYPCYKRAIGVEAMVRELPDNFADWSVGDRLKFLNETVNLPRRRVVVKAKLVVSAAGALHTPALLLRSGIRHRGMVGANLTLHPVLGAGGVLPGVETGLGSGVSMGVVVRQPRITADTTFPLPSKPRASTAPTSHSDRHPIALETPPAHVGLMGLLFPWASTAAHPASFSGQGGGLGVKLGLLSWRNSATFIALPRDVSQARNRVSIDFQGNPVLHYELTKEDEHLVLVGLEANLRIMRAAGAQFLFCAHENFPWYHAESSGTSDNEEERFEKYIQNMHKEGLKTAKMQVFSAHQMSSCRMASSPCSGPTSPSGELYECSGLYISDASVLPTSLGINPMVTIEAMSHMIAKNIIREIGTKYPQLQHQMRIFQEKLPVKQQEW